MAALRLPTLDVVLTRQFERRLRTLRAACAEEDPREPARRMRDQLIGKRLLRLVGEESRIGEGEPVDLTLDGLTDQRVPAIIQ